MKIIVIGGVAGGASFAARMRRLDELAEITIIERGDYISFANCGLPYYIGGVIKERSSLLLYTPEVFEKRFNLTVKTASEVVGIDKEGKTVSVKNVKTGVIETINYDELVISTGAEPVRPPLEGIDLEGIFTVRTIPDVDGIKSHIANKNVKKAVVVGGGYIGLEMAENFVHAGIETTVVERADHVIASFDDDMAALIHDCLRDKGVTLLLETKVEGFEKNGESIKVKTSAGELEAQLVIMSVGVRPESTLAKDAGLDLTPRGAISVNDRMCTSDKNIYAVGDAVAVTDFVTRQQTYIPLAGPANKQGHMVADIIAGIDREYNGTQGSAIIKIFDMTAASTGLSEKTALANNIAVETVIINAGSHAGYYPDSTRMWIKGVFDKGNRKLLGAQIVGNDGVDKRCDVLATAIRASMTAEDLTELELCYAPPFSSAKDPVNMLGYAMSNILSGLVKTVKWKDLESLPKDGSVIILDVRDSTAAGSIEGSINIPLLKLRDSLDKLDKNKKIYVHCVTGLTSYLACRVLSGYGYDCYNIVGGYSFYSALLEDTKNR